jgi:hypothetical protein
MQEVKPHIGCEVRLSRCEVDVCMKDSSRTALQLVAASVVELNLGYAVLNAIVRSV